MEKPYLDRGILVVPPGRHTLPVTVTLNGMPADEAGDFQELEGGFFTMCSREGDWRFEWDDRPDWPDVVTPSWWRY